MQPLRILHTESSTGMGGQELRILAESKMMARRGHTVVLAVPKGSRLGRRAEEEGMLVEPMGLTPKRFGILVGEFLSIMRRHQCHIVNSHGSLDSWTASIAGRLSPVRPLIVRTRHKSTPVSRTLRHRWLYNTLPHALITTGQSIREALMAGQGLDPERVESIPTGVDVDRFYVQPADPTVRAELGGSPDHLLVGTVAFLRSYKGLDLFIDAARIVCAHHPTARFVVVGEGPDEPLLRQKIQEAQLETVVRMVGFRADIPQVLAALDMFVLSSTEGEGLPQSLTQAMAMERPVVATNVGSVGEVVQHGVTGCLTPPNNPEQLVREIGHVLNDPSFAQHIATAGRQLIHRFYTAETMVERTEAFYGRLLNHRRLSGTTRHHKIAAG